MVSRNKRIATNTAFLYIRMLLIMTIQFFTVRITLKYLGVVDYGIYNVVCGVTNVFTFLTHTMTSASQRFLAYDLGIGDKVQLKRTFDTLVSLFSICAFVGVLLLGIIGTWFIHSYLVIPPERLDAALIAFYFTLFALFVSIYVLPYNSLIIAHEEMKAFAYISILDALLKLGVVYCLVIVSVDKLKLYSALTFVAYLIPSILYIGYCYKKYDEVTLKSDVEWSLSKKIVPFMSWNLLGGLSWMLCTQGLSILINMFFGPVANAAKAIADKVNASINGFSNNFMMAVQPQVVKTYAVGDYDAMHKVIYLASRMSFFLMMVLTLPISFNADGILSLWLEKHDNLTTIMLQTVLSFSLISALEVPINQAIRATGNIRNYQLYIGFVTLLVIPLAALLFYMKMPAYYGYVALIVIYGIAYIFRLYYLKKQIKVTYKQYFGKVLRPCILSILIAVGVCWIYKLCPYLKDIPILVGYFGELLMVFVIIVLVGLNKEERTLIKKFIKQKIR